MATETREDALLLVHRVQNAAGIHETKAVRDRRQRLARSRFEVRAGALENGKAILNPPVAREEVLESDPLLRAGRFGVQSLPLQRSA